MIREGIIRWVLEVSNKGLFLFLYGTYQAVNNRGVDYSYNS